MRDVVIFRATSSGERSMLLEVANIVSLVEKFRSRIRIDLISYMVEENDAEEFRKLLKKKPCTFDLDMLDILVKKIESSENIGKLSDTRLNAVPISAILVAKVDLINSVTRYKHIILTLKNHVKEAIKNNQTDIIKMVIDKEMYEKSYFASYAWFDTL